MLCKPLCCLVPRFVTAVWAVVTAALRCVRLVLNAACVLLLFSACARTWPAIAFNSLDFVCLSACFPSPVQIATGEADARDLGEWEREDHLLDSRLGAGTKERRLNCGLPLRVCSCLRVCSFLFAACCDVHHLRSRR